MSATVKTVVAYLDDGERLLEVARQCRDNGWSGLDLLMPYPVHGFEEALGIKRSWVPAARACAWRDWPSVPGCGKACPPCSPR